eukprot:4818697-Prymnesium_polylepis.1
MLLGGRSGTVTLSESLSRMGSAMVADAPVPSPKLAPPPPPAPPPPLHPSSTAAQVSTRCNCSCAHAVQAQQTGCARDRKVFPERYRKRKWFILRNDAGRSVRNPRERQMMTFCHTDTPTAICRVNASRTAVWSEVPPLEFVGTSVVVQQRALTRSHGGAAGFERAHGDAIDSKEETREQGYGQHARGAARLYEVFGLSMIASACQFRLR